MALPHNNLDNPSGPVDPYTVHTSTNTKELIPKPLFHGRRHSSPETSPKADPRYRKNLHHRDLPTPCQYKTPKLILPPLRHVQPLTYHYESPHLDLPHLRHVHRQSIECVACIPRSPVHHTQSEDDMRHDSDHFLPPLHFQRPEDPEVEKRQIGTAEYMWRPEFGHRVLSQSPESFWKLEEEDYEELNRHQFLHPSPASHATHTTSSDMSNDVIHPKRQKTFTGDLEMQRRASRKSGTMPHPDLLQHMNTSARKLADDNSGHDVNCTRRIAGAFESLHRSAEASA
jgi:hypothetical protein